MKNEQCKKINLLVALNKLKYRNVINVSDKSILNFFLEFSTSKNYLH